MLLGENTVFNDCTVMLPVKPPKLEVQRALSVITLFSASTANWYVAVKVVGLLLFDTLVDLKIGLEALALADLTSCTSVG